MCEAALIEKHFQFGVSELDKSASISKSNENQREILSFNRMMFKPYYKEFKVLFPDIDFVSSKEKHFEVTCRRKRVDKEV